MQNLLIPAGILLTLGILAVMWHITFRKPRKSEVTSNPAAILAQITGTPLDRAAYDYCEQEVPLYERYHSALQRQIVANAGSLDREALIQAAIGLAYTREIAEAYADHIIELSGEPLPAAMLHAPNLGGVGSFIPYSGPNYSDQESIVDEMRGLIRYSGTGRGE